MNAIVATKLLLMWFNSTNYRKTKDQESEEEEEEKEKIIGIQDRFLCNRKTPTHSSRSDPWQISHQFAKSQKVLHNKRLE